MVLLLTTYKRIFHHTRDVCWFSSLFVNDRNKSKKYVLLSTFSFSLFSSICFWIICIPFDLIWFCYFIQTILSLSFWQMLMKIAICLLKLWWSHSEWREMESVRNVSLKPSKPDKWDIYSSKNYFRLHYIDKSHLLNYCWTIHFDYNDILFL